MYYVIVASFLFLLHTCDVIAQNHHGFGFFPGPLMSRPCLLPCPEGYVPGACLCQYDPNIMSLCQFARCPQGEVCKMIRGKAVCVAVAGTNPPPSVDVCNLPMKPGPCFAFMRRFYFDNTDGTCKSFTYGGCQGNENRFSSMSDCESTCIADVPVVGSTNVEAVTTTPVRKVNEVCELPAQTGPCKAYFPSFFFNPATGQCQGFVFGGCQGNANRFDTKEECEQTCKPAGTTSPSQQPASGSGPSANSKCGLPKETGPCRAYIPSFFYNEQSGECQSFVYGGCRGNANRFDTKEECEQTCKPVGTTLPSQQPALGSGPQSSANSECDLPKETGPCRAYIPSFFYNKQSGECQSFVYGGCRGNANRFERKEQCEQKCKQAGAASQSQNTACMQPKETGFCFAIKDRWFFNGQSQTCQMFIYGGCGGNENNFMSKADCERQCVPKQNADLTPGQNVNPTCMLPKKVGNCRASLRRWFFSPTSQTCRRFTYGGCGGNGNNFRSRAECERSCVSTLYSQFMRGATTGRL